MRRAQPRENLQNEARVNERSRVPDSFAPIRVARPADVERPHDRRNPDEERLAREVHSGVDPAFCALLSPRAPRDEGKRPAD